jgi:hypothetical protein
MNRKMRKSLEFHQHTRSSTQRQRSSSPTYRSPAAAKSEDGFEPAHTHRRAPRTPPPPPSEAAKHARAPTPRRARPTNSQTRHAQFAPLHLGVGALAKAGGDAGWRTVTRHGIVPMVSVA